MDWYAAELILKRTSHRWLLSRNTKRWALTVDCFGDGKGVRNSGQLEGKEQQWERDKEHITQHNGKEMGQGYGFLVPFWLNPRRRKEIPVGEAGRSPCDDLRATRLTWLCRREEDTKKEELRRDFHIFSYKISISLASKLFLQTSQSCKHFFEVKS